MAPPTAGNKSPRAAQTIKPQVLREVLQPRGKSPARGRPGSPTVRGGTTAASRGRSPAAAGKPGAPVAMGASDEDSKANAARVRHHLGSKGETEYEFGGPVGAVSIFVVSHVLLYYVYFVLNHNGGAMFVPQTWQEVAAAASTVAASAAPTWFAAQLYVGFIALQVLFALVMPGLVLKGVKDKEGKQLTYNLNSVCCWWSSIALGAGLQYTGLFDLATFIRHYGPLMSVAVLFADLQSAYWYIYAFASGQTVRLTGNHVYDFFHGAILHPRLFGGRLDIKMFAEVRLSWYLLFLLSSACALGRYQETGSVGPGLWFFITAQFLYTNACAKGEHYIISTWDIVYEKYGWMLCFWNWAGVPFLYAKGAIYLYKYGPSSQLSDGFYAGLFAVLFAAYYVWDTAQSQKNHYRLSTSGTVVERWTFPMLPWNKIDEPRVLKTQNGRCLLIDGWWGRARKIHYTADIVMAFSWAMCSGFGAALPYIYPGFFFVMIMHRYQRDMHKCAQEYGGDWDRYLRAVPFAFIPGVI